jgi:uncharacterized YigZ family protein
MSSYCTLGDPLRVESPKIKGSRFIASLAPVPDALAARAFVERIAVEFKDASHSCYAWRIHAGDDGFYYSDAGEPSGSAGRPILDQLAGHDLIRVVAVVTRYFGGTKLGKGGLMRAYGGSVGRALQVAEIVEVVETRRVELRFDYALTGVIDRVLSAYGLSAEKADYGAEVVLEIAVELDLLREFTERIKEDSAARAHTTLLPSA